MILHIPEYDFCDVFHLAGSVRAAFGQLRLNTIMIILFSIEFFQLFSNTTISE